MFVRPTPPSLATLLLLAAGLFVGVAGCVPNVRGFGEASQPVVDRRLVEYPTGLELRKVAGRFTAATALAVDDDGYVYVGDRSRRGQEVRVSRIDPTTGHVNTVYPYPRRGFTRRETPRPRLYGPVGGILVHDGELYISARDERDRGMILAFDLTRWTPGGRSPTSVPPVRTVVADLPAQGDYSVTDLAIHPLTGRLYFGLGSATNSGVVGVDNWAAGWLRNHPDFADRPHMSLRIFGYRFDTEDPASGLLRPDRVNTAPFNPFRHSAQRIPPAENGMPTSAVYSIDPRGGDLRVEAHGIRHPRGLAFNLFGNLYATNQGMELRGTRPVKDDPDALVRIPLSGVFGPVAGAGAATWLGFPDFSADLRPVTEPQFQPPPELLGRTGYTELSFLIDHGGSGLLPPDRSAMLSAAFPALSGAAGIAVVPDGLPRFEPFERMIVVALSGDRAPFATSGLPLVAPQGRRVVVVDPDRRRVHDFVHNTETGDREQSALHRPVDVAFGPDGSLYLLDMGRLTNAEGRERYPFGSGALYRLSPRVDPPDPDDGPDDVTEDDDPF